MFASASFAGAFYFLFLSTPRPNCPDRLAYGERQKFFKAIDHFIVQNRQKCPVTIEGLKIFLILFVQTDGLAPLVSEG